MICDFEFKEAYRAMLENKNQELTNAAVKTSYDLQGKKFTLREFLDELTKDLEMIGMKKEDVLKEFSSVVRRHS